MPIVVAKNKIAGFPTGQAGQGGADVPIAWQGRGDGADAIVGVLDIDCEAVEGFDDEDIRGLEGVVQLIAQACDW